MNYFYMINDFHENEMSQIYNIVLQLEWMLNQVILSSEISYIFSIFINAICTFVLFILFDSFLMCT